MSHALEPHPLLLRGVGRTRWWPAPLRGGWTVDAVRRTAVARAARGPVHSPSSSLGALPRRGVGQCDKFLVETQDG
ncbi:hypothetical protein NKH18_03645 [Streptomyces sp. M10(2022)]